jgi:hypothetical protein
VRVHYGEGRTRRDSPTRLFIAATEHICWALVVDRIGWLRGTCPGGHGPAGWRQRARLANNAASGCAAAKARRTRLAVSTMRAAILIRRIRKVANWAVASGCGFE